MQVYPSKKKAKEAGARESNLEMQQIAEPKSFVRKALANTVKGICNNVGTTSIKVYLTDSDSDKNFRKQVAVTFPYKGNRKAAKPVHYEYIRSMLNSDYEALVVSGYEADDQLGLDQTTDTIIATIDKDLLMVPGKHYNISTKQVIEASDPGQLNLTSNGKKYKLTGYGFKWFCAQMLLGDDVDNIICIPRYGPARVYKSLEKCTTTKQMWEVVVKIYKAKSTLERLDENAQLLWIMRPNYRHYKDYIEENCNG